MTYFKYSKVENSETWLNFYLVQAFKLYSGCVYTSLAFSSGILPPLSQFAPSLIFS